MFKRKKNDTSLWVYPDSSRDVSIESVSTNYCIFCNNKMNIISCTDKDLPLVTSMGYSFCNFKICYCCGWWSVHSHFDDMWSTTKNIVVDKGAAGSLKELNTKNISPAIFEIRSYLIEKYKSRLTLSPRLFEETVGSVFKDLGYTVDITGYSNDGGIDIVLIDVDGSKIGVQVKRWKNKIKVEQIRAFAGALILGKFTKGIYVTTSDYQSGTEKLIIKYKMRGYPIELMNSEKFYDALNIAQKNRCRIPNKIDYYLSKIKEIKNESYQFPDP